MATYNGEKYIEAQLNSLATQKHPPVELVICDDGSSDGTLQLIEEFSLTAPFPVIINLNPSNLGYADNFLKAASLCTGEWIAFCDQDDVWLPNRLSDAAKAIAKNDDALLVLQNAFLCREDLSHNGRLFPDTITPGYHPPRSQYGFWGWPGFLQTVRADVFRKISLDERPRGFKSETSPVSHDSWTCMIANATGGIFILKRPGALYRRHEKAVTGFYRRRSFGRRIATSLPVGSGNYTFLSDVALETAHYFEIITYQSSNYLECEFRDIVVDFKRLADIQSARALVYSGNLIVRLRYFFRILFLGGYVGRPSISMGWKSGAKDALSCFGIIILIKNLIDITNKKP